MKFSLDDLQAFVAIAERGSFRGAADAVHLSQPALSRRIEKLEAALGVRLLDRTMRPVSPTAVGREFYKKTRALLDERGAQGRAARPRARSRALFAGIFRERLLVSRRLQLE